MSHDTGHSPFSKQIPKPTIQASSGSNSLATANTFSSNTGIQSSSDDGTSCQTDDTAGTGAHRVSVGQESGGRCRCLPHFCECFYWHSDPVHITINLMPINQSIRLQVTDWHLFCYQPCWWHRNQHGKTNYSAYWWFHHGYRVDPYRGQIANSQWPLEERLVASYCLFWQVDRKTPRLVGMRWLVRNAGHTIYSSRATCAVFLVNDERDVFSQEFSKWD